MLRGMCGAPVLSALLLAAFAAAQGDIVNYREYSPTLSSSGQPSAAQIDTLAGAGFDRVIYLAFTDHESSLLEEDRRVREAGLGFIQIPVLWDQPNVEDFTRFAAVLAAEPKARTLVHCQINLRASAFVFLYRVIHLGVPIADAKADMNAIWAPDAQWREFIFRVLSANSIDPHCDVCDW